MEKLMQMEIEIENSERLRLMKRVYKLEQRFRKLEVIFCLTAVMLIIAIVVLFSKL